MGGRGEGGGSPVQLANLAHNIEGGLTALGLHLMQLYLLVSAIKDVQTNK